LPIKCSEVNVIALAAARDQLFAEAMTERPKTPGQEWWQAPADIWKTAQDEQEARYTPDPWEEPIWDWLNSRSRNRVTVDEVLRLCLGITADKVDQKHANRMAGISQRLGWGKVRRRDGERKRRRWAYEKV
jgi:predicted P-loop ATPase